MIIKIRLCLLVFAVLDTKKHFANGLIELYRYPGRELIENDDEAYKTKYWDAHHESVKMTMTAFGQVEKIIQDSEVLFQEDSPKKTENKELIDLNYIPEEESPKNTENKELNHLKHILKEELKAIYPVAAQIGSALAFQQGTAKVLLMLTNKFLALYYATQFSIAKFQDYNSYGHFEFQPTSDKAKIALYLIEFSKAIPTDTIDEELRKLLKYGQLMYAWQSIMGIILYNLTELEKMVGSKRNIWILQGRTKEYQRTKDFLGTNIHDVPYANSNDSITNAKSYIFKENAGPVAHMVTTELTMHTGFRILQYIETKMAWKLGYYQPDISNLDYHIIQNGILSPLKLDKINTPQACISSNVILRPSPEERSSNKPVIRPDGLPVT